eukprot:2991115-Amphidinium_carterae.1
MSDPGCAVMLLRTLNIPSDKWPLLLAPTHGLLQAPGESISCCSLADSTSDSHVCVPDTECSSWSWTSMWPQQHVYVTVSQAQQDFETPTWSDADMQHHMLICQTCITWT